MLSKVLYLRSQKLLVKIYSENFNQPKRTAKYQAANIRRGVISSFEFILWLKMTKTGSSLFLGKKRRNC